jgi:mRNA-degrading endonuclease RelE of RelBE toxin-antitoxin system
MYDIEYTEEAEEDLAYFRKHEQALIIDEVERRLRYEPAVPTRNRKQLTPNQTAGWELRIGDFRVFYNPDEVVQIVAIVRIGEKRGNAFFFRGEKRRVMTTWNYRVFREEDGDYIIREVFYDENGAILGCTKEAVEPMGKSIEELEQDLCAFRDALQLPVLTVAEVDAAVAAQSPKSKTGRKTISHADLVKKLGLDTARAQAVNEPVLVSPTT